MLKFLFGFAVAVVLLDAASALCALASLTTRDLPSIGRKQDRDACSRCASIGAHRCTQPAPATDANLIAGMKIYQTNCANCTEIFNTLTRLWARFLSRAPQFAKTRPICRKIRTSTSSSTVFASAECPPEETLSEQQTCRQPHS